MINKAWQNKQFRTLVWRIFNAIIAYIVTYISTGDVAISAGLAPTLTVIIQYISKYINESFFNDLGVSEETKKEEVEKKIEELKILSE